MSKKLNITIPESEMRDFRAWLKTQNKEIKQESKEIIGHAIRFIHHQAVMKAPVNYGFLRASLHTAITDRGYGGMVYAGRYYAPYREWGTGIKVRVPEFVLSMFGVNSMDWKGRGIRQVNTSPKPYLFESARVGFNFMLNDLKRLGFRERTIR